MSNKKESHFETRKGQTGNTVEDDTRRYRIGISQSVSTGVIAIDGYVEFGDNDDSLREITKLLANMEYLEKKLQDMGYSIASKNAPKIKKENEHITA